MCPGKGASVEDTRVTKCRGKNSRAISAVEKNNCQGDEQRTISQRAEV